MTPAMTKLRVGRPGILTIAVIATAVAGCGDGSGGAPKPSPGGAARDRTPDTPWRAVRIVAGAPGGPALVGDALRWCAALSAIRGSPNAPPAEPEADTSQPCQNRRDGLPIREPGATPLARARPERLDAIARSRLLSRSNVSRPSSAVPPAG